LKRHLTEDRPDWLRIMRLVRFEIGVVSAAAAGFVSSRQRNALRSLRQQKHLKVQIGSGANVFPGWINVDAGKDADVRIDLRGRLPFADGSVALIYTEHFLDHLEFPNGIRNVLSECARILEPGGTMRAVVHDARRLLQAYVDRDAAFFHSIGLIPSPDDDSQTLIEIINHLFRFNGFHQFIYDYETLAREMRRAGFSTVTESTFRGSAHEELNIDLDGRDRAPQSIYVEAVK
jgi:predicted SAM-dependent methyltransferase